MFQKLPLMPVKKTHIGTGIIIRHSVLIIVEIFPFAILRKDSAKLLQLLRLYITNSVN